MSELAKLLSNDYAILQVGNQNDPSLPNCAMRYSDVSYELLSYLYANAAFAIAIENGLSHWAGHHDKRCYTIYTGRYWATPAHVGYPSQIPILSPKDARAVAELILSHERNDKAKPIVVL
jgi:hypothetical protein